MDDENFFNYVSVIIHSWIVLQDCGSEFSPSDQTCSTAKCT